MDKGISPLSQLPNPPTPTPTPPRAGLGTQQLSRAGRGAPSTLPEQGDVCVG